MKEKLRSKRGITLIALVITIIVMLILVSVTISLVTNGGLFQYAGRAVKDTQEAKDKEITLSDGSVIIDGVKYSSIDAYKTSLNCNHNWGNAEITKEATCLEEGERTLTCSMCGAKKTEAIAKTNHTYASNSAWEIIPEEGKEKNTCTVCGNVIKRYIVGATILGYDPSNNHTISTSYTSLGSFDAETSGEYGDGSTGNGYSNQKFTLTYTYPLVWKVLGEDNGQIIITPSTIDQGVVTFKGRSGYAHYVDELDKICSIYGQGEYADTTKFNLTKDIENTDGTLARQDTIKNASGARSISLEDFKRIGYKVQEDSYTFRKDATNNKIYNESISSTFSNYEKFFYWSEYANNAAKPYSFLELSPGERVTINRIKSISGAVTTLAYNMLSNYRRYGYGSSYRSYFLSARSCSISYDSDGNPVQGALNFVPIVAVTNRYNVFEVGLSDAVCTSDQTYEGTGRHLRPVVYLKSDVTVSYDAESGKYTINPYQ